MTVTYSVPMGEKTYLFFRAEGFYPIRMRDDDDAIANAEHNAGTIRVEDTQGRIVWHQP